MDSDSSVDKGVIIVLAVLIPFTVFILILCGLHHRRMSKKAKLHSIRYEQGGDETGKKHDRLSNVVSMRDRIREWKVAPSEMVELVDICKSRGVLDIPVDNIGNQLSFSYKKNTFKFWILWCFKLKCTFETANIVF